MLDTLLEVLIDMKDKNAITEYCISQQETSQSIDYVKAAKCSSELRAAKRHIEDKELNLFLAKYPHYRYPGQALPNNVIKPLDKCWGRNRIYTLNGRGC